MYFKSFVEFWISALFKSFLRWILEMNVPKDFSSRYRDRSSNSSRSTAKTVISISISYDFSISTVLEGI